MTTLVAQVRIPRLSNLPKDIVTNTFHFQTASDVATAAPNIVARLQDFYATPPSGETFAIKNYLSRVSGTTWEVRFYDLADPKPRVPRYTGSINVSYPTQDGMPSEVAFCLSYRGASVAGVPLGSTRGRIYLGPLNIISVDTSYFGGEYKPANTMATIARKAGKRLADPAALDWWGVWSPTRSLMTKVNEVSTDDAFDTQRRRGSAPTARIRLPA